MKELGDYLRRTRIDNGVNLEEAAEDMNISVTQLENIESGNVRAFKDIYKLKQYVKFYAKYLGLNPDKVIDQFNEFLFEHTSKISLEDIKNARDNSNDKEESSKIKSPYTIIHEPKENVLPIFVPIVVLIIILIIAVLVLIGRASRKSPRTSELKSSKIEIGELLWIYLLS